MDNLFIRLKHCALIQDKNIVDANILWCKPLHANILFLFSYPDNYTFIIKFFFDFYT